MARRDSPHPRQKKSLSQVFLRTEWPVQKVVEKMQSWKVRRVVEIGPGPGILTRALLDHDIKVTAVEKDDRFVERLEEYQRTRGADKPGRLEVVHQDILRFDLGAWIAKSHENAAVVGNIPYNISSPIVQWLLPFLPELIGANFMVQLEFGMRLAGAADTKAYGSLSVFTQLRSQVEIDCKVDRTCFQPVPKVDSALISFRPKPNMASEEVLQRVEVITRSAFTQRRKKLRNAVRNFLDEELEKTCPIDLTRRPDSLRPEEYMELANFLLSGKKKP